MVRLPLIPENSPLVREEAGVDLQPLKWFVKTTSLFPQQLSILYGYIKCSVYFFSVSLFSSRHRASRPCWRRVHPHQQPQTVKKCGKTLMVLDSHTLPWCSKVVYLKSSCENDDVDSCRFMQTTATLQKTDSTALSLFCNVLVLSRIMYPMWLPADPCLRSRRWGYLVYWLFVFGDAFMCRREPWIYLWSNCFQWGYLVASSSDPLGRYLTTDLYQNLALGTVTFALMHVPQEFITTTLRSLFKPDFCFLTFIQAFSLYS